MNILKSLIVSEILNRYDVAGVSSHANGITDEYDAEAAMIVHNHNLGLINNKDDLYECIQDVIFESMDVRVAYNADAINELWGALHD